MVNGIFSPLQMRVVRVRPHRIVTVPVPGLRYSSQPRIEARKTAREAQNKVRLVQLQRICRQCGVYLTIIIH